MFPLCQTIRNAHCSLNLQQSQLLYVQTTSGAYTSLKVGSPAFIQPEVLP